MPVLEITQLRLKGLAPGDAALLESLSVVRRILKTRSEFYCCIEDPKLIFILGQWESLEAHHEFLASSKSGAVLAPQESLLEFRWTAHVELEAMMALPLEAPVIALTRRIVKDDDVAAYGKAAAKERQAIISSSNHNVVSGWRLDSPAGSHEALIFSGWENAQAHVAFTSSQRQPETDCDDHVANLLYEAFEVHHAWNMERSPTSRIPSH